MASWGAAKVKSMATEAVANGIERLRKNYSGEAKRNDLVTKCWAPPFGFKDRVAIAEAEKMKPMEVPELNAHCENGYLFEFGAPNVPPLEKARPRVKGAEEDDEFFFETSAREIPDLPEGEQYVRTKGEEKYFGSISEGDRDE